MEFLPSNGWVTLRPFPWKCFPKPFVSPYKDLQDKLVRMRGRHNGSSVIAGVGFELFLPLSRTLGPKSMTRVDPRVLPHLEREVI